MKASQYVILNTKNKIGKVIRKKLSILQYSSANCWAETALIAFSCISHLNLSLHSILMFILRWPDTYRCFLNNIAAYLKYKKYLTLFILLLWIEIKTIIMSHVIWYSILRGKTMYSAILPSKYCVIGLYGFAINEKRHNLEVKGLIQYMYQQIYQINIFRVIICNG